MGESGEGEPGAAALQFDQVEFATGQGARTCGRCRRSFADEYYEVAGSVVCPACATAIRGGSGGRAAWLRGLLFGSGAAVLGTLVWFAIIKLADMELGLIAIAVGLFVGTAVRRGSRGRGGWRYQTLAMALTYLSITGAYAPMVVKGFVQAAQKDRAQKTEAAAQAGATDVATPEKSAPSAPGAGKTIVGLVLFVLLVIGISAAAPFLAGASNIMGLIIIGIALYEAWKINRLVVVNGPFRASPAPPEGAAAPAPAP